MRCTSWWDTAMQREVSRSSEPAALCCDTAQGTPSATASWCLGARITEPAAISSTRGNTLLMAYKQVSGNKYFLSSYQPRHTYPYFWQKWPWKHTVILTAFLLGSLTSKLSRRINSHVSLLLTTDKIWCIKRKVWGKKEMEILQKIVFRLQTSTVNLRQLIPIEALMMVF